MWARDRAGIRRKSYQFQTGGDTVGFGRVVSTMAARRIMAPPIQAEGPRVSCRTKMPSREPMRGSMLRRTAACEAGTLVIPQFQSSVEEAVERIPLPARASQALREMWWIGGRP